MPARRSSRRRGGPSSSSPLRSSSPVLATSSPPPSSPGSVQPPSSDILNTATPREDDEGEELVGDGMERDYRAIPGLDTYEAEQIDTQDYDEMSFDARRAAEEEMARRDNDRGRVGRIPAALLRSDDDDEEEIRRRAPRRAADQAPGFAPQDEAMEEEVVNLEEYKGPMREYILKDAPRRELARRFHNFLTTYMDKKGNSVYAARIRNMCSENRESLDVSYEHLVKHVDLLAMWVADYPTEMLKIFDEVALQVVLTMFADYENIHPDIHVRIADLPIEDSLRDLRQVHLNGLVKVRGVVTRRTKIFPELKYAKYNCLKCDYVLGPYYKSSLSDVQLGSCPECQSKGPFSVNSEQTVYRNYQKITLQESPGTVPAGRLPRYKEVILRNDLIDAARPGEEIEVTGIYRNNFDMSLNVSNGFPVFSTIIEGNFLSKQQEEYATSRLTDEDVREIRALARDERAGTKILNSIAPSIYGHDNIKLGLALALFGGEGKDIARHRIRGDINVLILGDPGTAKSQFLKYVEKTSHRAVFTTGQGASAVGLTATVRKDPVSREWTLEGGALVLADRGVCLIDEFDKMNDHDRTSIHEAMEQQSISISKAGIVTTLQARCSIIAAANPVSGRYDPSIPFNQNVDLGEPILSRFDLMCVVRDTVDPFADERLANFVVGNHVRGHPQSDEHKAELRAQEAGTVSTSMPADQISQDLLRKYIMYSKKAVRPKLTNIDEDKITQLYADLRRESLTNGGMPMTVRHVESVIRLAEAHARLHLRDYVDESDVDVAISLALESFISCQKHAVEKSLRKQFAKYLRFKKHNNELLRHVLIQMFVEEHDFLQMRFGPHQPEQLKVELEDFKARAREVDITQLEPFFKSALFTSDYEIDRQRKLIIKHNMGATS